jgi:hypothetical protein
MATVHNRERGRLVLLALFLVSYHTIVSNQTKKAFIYSRCLLSHLWTRKAKTQDIRIGVLQIGPMQLKHWGRISRNFVQQYSVNRF